MQISTKGLAFLERHEGVVLKAYRDVVGVWTIGAGLTAASGVVKPRAGMVITLAEALQMLAEALRRNYEPAVVKAMARPEGAKQHEFDAAVSFHFNTGAIARASWVRAWKAGDATARAKLALWNKAGGRVLSGLVRRRNEEAALLYRGDYGFAQAVRRDPATGDDAVWVAPVTPYDIPRLREALIKLGYGGAPYPALGNAAVRRFQAAHGLTVDGIVGRATASAIQRVMDARVKAAVAAVPVTAAVPVAATDVADQLTGLPWLPEAGLAGAALYGLWQAWRYRDVIAPILDKPLPRVAAFLRSF